MFGATSLSGSYISGNPFNTIGSSGWNGYAEGYIGKMREILAFSGDMSATNRQIMEGYLAWKWGLHSSLPTSHPYKSAKPMFAPQTTSTTGSSTPVVNPYTNTTANIIRWTLDNPIDLTQLNRNYLYSPTSASLTSLFAPANTYTINHILPSIISDSDSALLGAANPLTQSGGRVLENMNGGNYKPYSEIAKPYKMATISVTPWGKSKKYKSKRVKNVQ